MFAGLICYTPPVHAIHPEPVPLQPVRCPVCRTLIFDGEVLKSPVTRFGDQSESLCKRCKTWVPVPVVISVDFFRQKG